MCLVYVLYVSACVCGVYGGVFISFVCVLCD